MRAATELRGDFDGPALRRLAKVSRHAGQTRRLLALAAIYDGGSRGDAACIGDVGRQTIRDWVLRFNARGPEGLVDAKAPGHQAALGEAERLALKEIVEAGPIPAVHGVVRWRLKDLVQWLFETFGISLSETTVSRELKKLGYAKLSARPRHHAQNEETLKAFKKTSPPSWQTSRRACLPAPR
jgi:transposase